MEDLHPLERLREIISCRSSLARQQHTLRQSVCVCGGGGGRCLMIHDNSCLAASIAASHRRARAGRSGVDVARRADTDTDK